MSVEDHVSIHSFKLNERVTLIRTDDLYSRFFEGVWHIPEGITYNSYLVFGDNGVALLDTTRRGFENMYLDELQRNVDIKDIDYIVVHHTEQDHSSVIPSILALNSKAKIYGSPLARRMLESFYGLDLSNRFVPIRSGAKLDLGGVELVFEPAPWLHWPETIMSFLEPLGVLFSGDAWGSYGHGDEYADEQLGGLIPSYIRTLRKYFATVLGHYKKNVADALGKLDERGWTRRIRAIAPLHGLVITWEVARAISLYRNWANGVLDRKRAVVVLATSYGMANTAFRQAVGYLQSMGLEVDVYTFDTLSQSGFGDILGSIYDAGAVVFVVSTYEEDVPPTLRCLAGMICDKAANQQPTAVISSYGWSGGGGRKLAERLKGCMDVRDVYEYPGTRLDAGRLRDALGKLFS